MRREPRWPAAPAHRRDEHRYCAAASTGPDRDAARARTNRDEHRIAPDSARRQHTTGRNTKRTVQHIVVDDSCSERPGTRRGRGKFTTVVLDIAERKVKRTVTSIVIDDASRVHPVSARRVGTSTTTVIDVAAVEAMLRGDAEVERGRDRDDELGADDESLDLVRGEPEVTP